VALQLFNNFGDKSHGDLSTARIAKVQSAKCPCRANNQD
jgi:hypothetical protein